MVDAYMLAATASYIRTYKVVRALIKGSVYKYCNKVS